MATKQQGVKLELMLNEFGNTPLTTQQPLTATKQSLVQKQTFQN
jgi:hypothetical protein